MQLTDVLQYVEATLDRISPARAQELAKQMARGEGREQVAKAAQELIDWSQRNRERVRALVQREVAAQLSAVGIPTNDDYEELKRRVSELERAAAKRSAAKRTSAKPSAAKRAAAKRTAGNRTAAKGATASGSASVSKPAAKRTTSTEPPDTRGGSEPTRGS
jgi:polyhydroxyalkanoate synthesis regulator phasin